ncbi:MAG: DUF3800 domain-containing protein [Ignavibacteriales bacterium]|nr:DUF3800 domain-containing protein [Ignavibacteriales bacterium]
MEDERLHIFVDESGTPKLSDNLENADYYVVVALLISDSLLENFKNSACEIKFNYAGSGELKSSSVGNNLSRRQKILQDIKESDFKYYCLVVNKSEVWRDSGLQHKKVFYKFLHRMIYSRIKRNFSGLSILADNYGDSEFMESFKSYLFGFNNLFDDINFEQSSKVPLLQIADFLSGSVRRIYEKDDPIELLELINYPNAPIEEWPPNFSRKSNFSELEGQDKFDEFIRSAALNSAKRFVESNLGSEKKELNEQALAVRYLLYRYFENSSEYVFRLEIAKYLNLVANSNYSEQQISTNIISKVRESGVVIASTDKGVKIPFSYIDIFEWISRVDSQVTPYLKRVEYARDEFLLASKNEYDIIDHKVFPELGGYLIIKK